MRRISLYREHSYTRQMETEGLLMRLKQNSSSPEMPWSPAQKQRKSLKPLLWPLFRDRNDLGWASHILPTPPERRQHEYTVRLSSLMRGGGGRAGREARCKWAFEKTRIKSQNHFHDTRVKSKSQGQLSKVRNQAMVFLLFEKFSETITSLCSEK